MTPYTPQDVFQEYEARLAAMRAEIKRLEQENASLREGLEFYEKPAKSNVERYDDLVRKLYAASKAKGGEG